MLRKQFQRLLLLHVIIYLSPKCLKRVEKVKKTDFFKKQGFRQCWTKVLGIVLQYSYFSVISRFLLKTVQHFRNFLAVLPPPTLYKVETRKKNSGYTRPTCDFLQKNNALVQQVSFQVACKISQCCIRARFHGCKALTVFFFPVCVCFSVFFLWF